jgi:DNA-directed RNA polymerase specialized sigma24 family protein
MGKASVEELAELCQKEDARFRDKKPGPVGFCFELFRRAVVERSQQAWNAVYDQYYDRMVGWIGGDLLDAEELVHEALEKFWSRVTPETLARANGIGSVIAYLKRCVRSACVDRWRQAKREHRALAALELEASPNEACSLEQIVLDDIVNQECAKYVYSRLKDEQERLVVHLNLELGVKPAEIARMYPSLFPTAQHVNRVRERLMRRLSTEPVLWNKYKISK